MQYFLLLLACWRSWTSCLDTWHHWFYQISTDKKIKKWLTLLEIMGHVWIFQSYNTPNRNLKNNTKMGHWAQNQSSGMAIPVLWPEPCRKWLRWTEEKKHSHGAGNLKGLEWFLKGWGVQPSDFCKYFIISFNVTTLKKWHFATM